jgi:hypothetical protein
LLAFCRVLLIEELYYSIADRQRFQRHRTQPPLPEYGSAPQQREPQLIIIDLTTGSYNVHPQPSPVISISVPHNYDWSKSPFATKPPPHPPSASSTYDNHRVWYRYGWQIGAAYRMLYHVGFNDSGSPKHFQCIHYGRQLPLYVIYEWIDPSTAALNLGWQEQRKIGYLT